MDTVDSPKEFGKRIGRTTNTLQKWDREGKQTAYRRLPTNRRYSTHDQSLAYREVVAKQHGLTCVYSRVSGVTQKPDLTNLVYALETSCTQQAITVDEWMSDIGSGLNYKLDQFNRLIELVEGGQVRRVIIAHRDQLVRFGFDFFETFAQRHGTEIIVVNAENLSPEQELVQDLIAMMTVFSARLHGLRSYKKAIREATLRTEGNRLTSRSPIVSGPVKSAAHTMREISMHPSTSGMKLSV